MALLVPTGLAFLLLGVRRGMERKQLSKLAGDALTDVGSMALLFGAAGGFKQVIQDSQAGQFIARQFLDLPLSPVLIAFLVSALMRIFLGSATAAILTASALLAGLAERLPDQRTLLVLAVANGVTVGTQPADSGFWLIKEYVNLSVRQVLVPYNLCRITMAVTGLLLLLAWERWMTGRN
jgi:H+/gluconate symporter-like permease